MLFNKIRDLCKKKGLSINQLEEKAGLAKNSLYTWQRRDPSCERLYRVAKALGTTMDKLMEG